MRRRRTDNQKSKVSECTAYCVACKTGKEQEHTEMYTHTCEGTR
jgi:hypothetical protein